MIWLIGFLAFIFYRTFNAGMKSDRLFHTDKMEYTADYSKKKLVRSFDGEKLFLYIVWTVGIGVTWPLSIPCMGIYLLGKRYAAK
jgi:hypothetical protein